MAGAILTPNSIWKEFDDSLSLNEFIVKHEEEAGINYEFVCFSGRQTKVGRVRIYGLFVRPVLGESFPTILLLPDAGKAFDRAFIRRFAERGYAVFAVDYSGKLPGRERFTVYPDDISYANLNEVGRHMDYVDTDARETSWYEWTAVGRYALRYLRARRDVAKIGVLGVRTGGEIAWKLMLSEEIACGIPICAAGWRAYRGINKYDKNLELASDAERQRFLAGIDSQAYAQFVNCPVLMLCSTNDRQFDYDRAYDTYSRINSAVDCVISYTVNNSSYIGEKGLIDLDMFLNKYLKGQQVFIPKPLDISVDFDADGDLAAFVANDQRGEIKKITVFLAEDCYVSSQRDWRKVQESPFDGSAGICVKLNAYQGAQAVFAFAQAEYSSGFTASSKIAFKAVNRPFGNGIPRRRLLYSAETDGTECFAADDVADCSLGDCIFEDEEARPKIIEGHKGILGISSVRGLKTYRISNSLYAPHEGALLSLDCCSWEPGLLQITIACQNGDAIIPYRAVVQLKGSDSWENKVLSFRDFKADNGASLPSFTSCVSLGFAADFRYCLNNILWL